MILLRDHAIVILRRVVPHVGLGKGPVEHILNPIDVEKSLKGRGAPVVGVALFVKGEHKDILARALGERFGLASDRLDAVHEVLSPLRGKPEWQSERQPGESTRSKKGGLALECLLWIPDKRFSLPRPPTSSGPVFVGICSIVRRGLLWHLRQR